MDDAGEDGSGTANPSLVSAVTRVSSPPALLTQLTYSSNGVGATSKSKALRYVTSPPNDSGSRSTRTSTRYRSGSTEGENRCVTRSPPVLVTVVAVLPSL